MSDKNTPLDMCNSDWLVFELGQVTSACEDEDVMHEIESLVLRFALHERRRALSEQDG